MFLKGITVIYWSGTGNTKKMAEAVAEGASREGVDVVIVPVSEATKADLMNRRWYCAGLPGYGR